MFFLCFYFCLNGQVCKTFGIDRKAGVHGRKKKLPGYNMMLKKITFSFAEMKSNVIGKVMKKINIEQKYLTETETKTVKNLAASGDLTRIFRAEGRNADH